MDTSAERVELKASFLILRAYVLSVALAEVVEQLEACRKQAEVSGLQ